MGTRRGAALNLHALGLEAVRNPTLGPSLLADSGCEAADCAAFTPVGSATLSKEAGAPSGYGAKVLRVAYNGVSSPGARQIVLPLAKLIQLENWIRNYASSNGASIYHGTLIIDSPGMTTWGKARNYFISTSTGIDVRCTASAGGWSEWDEINARVYSQQSVPGLLVSHASLEQSLISDFGIVPIDIGSPCFADKGIRIHHAASNLMKSSSTSVKAQWAPSALTLRLGLSESLAQPIAAWFETVANAAHKITSTQFTPAASGAHVLSLFAAGIGRTSLLVRISLAAGDLDTVLTVTSALARYSVPFTVEAGDVGAAKTITIMPLNAASQSIYAGDITKGIHADMVQVETGTIATPYMRTYTAASSGVSSVYSCSDAEQLYRLTGKALEPEIRFEVLELAPSGSTPLWAITYGTTSYLKLTHEAANGGALKLTTFKTGDASPTVTTLAAGWNPTIGDVYDVRIHAALDAPLNAVQCSARIIDETAKTVVEVAPVTIAAGLSLPLSSITHWYWGADETGLVAWNGHLKEPRA